MRLKKIWVKPILSLLAVIFSLLLFSGIYKASAGPSAEWPNVQLVQVVTGLNKPTHITHAGDASDRLFVIEQRGIIKIIQNNQVTGTFLSITDRVRSPDSNPAGGSEETCSAWHFHLDMEPPKTTFMSTIQIETAITSFPAFTWAEIQIPPIQPAKS